MKCAYAASNRHRHEFSDDSSYLYLFYALLSDELIG